MKHSLSLASAQALIWTLTKSSPQTFLCRVLGIFLFASLCLSAQAVSVDTSKLYHIECQFRPGFVGIGSYHSKDYALYYVMDEQEVSPDGVWRIRGSEEKGYIIQNEETKQAMTWCDIYRADCKYLMMADMDFDNPDQRWLFEEEDNSGYFVIRSKSQPAYRFNLRENTWLLGGYSGGGRPSRDFYRLNECGDAPDDGSGEGGDDKPDPRLGYCYIVSAMQWNDGETKALYSDGANALWGKHHEQIAYLWHIEAAQEKNTYHLTHPFTNTQLSAIYKAARTTMQYAQGEEAPVTFDYVTEQDGAEVVNIRLANAPSGNYNYVHCEGHENGRGTGGYIVGWCNTMGWSGPGPSEWILRPVSEEQAAAMMRIVKSITLDANKLRMYVGQTTELHITTEPEDAWTGGIVWSTTSPQIVTVTDEGIVTAQAPGVATIKVEVAGQSDLYATCQITVTEKPIGEPIPHSSDYCYAKGTDGSLTAIPTDFITARALLPDKLYVTLTTGKVLVLNDIEAVTDTVPVDLPRFASYKFNNKFNDQLFQDAEATEDDLLLSDTIRLSVTQIGKSLTPSFQLSDEESKAYIDGVRQKSKVTRHRWDAPLTYTLGHKNWQQLEVLRTDDGGYFYEYKPYGREITIDVDFLTEHATTPFQVPIIRITTETGRVPTSKDYFINATITIDGGGAFPDMLETPIQMKGRGNSSWSNSSTSKNPYRIRFEEKQKPLGMTKGKNWVLLANKQAGSMTTNALEQKAAALMGCASPCHIVPVELYINGSYRGSYNFCEKVALSNNSVSLDDESCAAMLELDTYTDESIWRNNAYGIPTKIHDPDFDEDTGLLIASDDVMADWANALSVLRDADSEAYTGLIDVDYLTSFLMVSDLCFHSELMHPKSTFLYSENVLDNGFSEMGMDETPWIFGPVWDCDWSFGYQNSGAYFRVGSTDDFFAWLRGTSAGRFWTDLRYRSAQVDSVYNRHLYDFLTDGRMQELLDYATDYYAYAGKSLGHNRANVCDERDGYNYASVTTNSISWLQARAKTLLDKLPTYDTPPTPALPDEPDMIDPDEMVLMGDINDDRAITAADVVCLLNHLLGLPNETFISSRADLNDSGNLSISDVVLLCRLVMMQPASISRQLHLPQSTASLCLHHATTQQNDDTLMPVTLTIDEGQYAALQLDVTLPEGTELGGITLPASMSQLTCQTSLLYDGRYRVIAYADADHSLSEGEHEMQLQLMTTGGISGPVAITAATLSTHLGEEERLPSTQCTLSVEDCADGATSPQATQSGQTHIYDVAGRELSHIRQHGVYITGGRKILR